MVKLKNVKRREGLTETECFSTFPLSISVAIFVQILMSNAMHNLFFERRMYDWEPKQMEFFMFYFSIFREEGYL